METQQLKYEASLSFANEMDLMDPLRGFRERFLIPKKDNGEPCIYFCGNSLGLQPQTTREYIEQELKAWETLGTLGFFSGNNPWMHYHERLTASIAKITGAKPEEVVAMNTLTVNIHLAMVSFYRPTAKRNKIVIERGAFPSDQYAVASQVSFHGYDPKTAVIELKPRAGENFVRTEDIEALLEKEGDSIALILLGGVNYYSGQAFDMKRITEAGHRAGCVVGFDLAHAIGNIQLSLHEWNVDFAVWCTYKYLNAGPGSVGGLFVHEKHSREFNLPRFAGWWGNEKETRFLMRPEFKASPGAAGWQHSTASPFQLASLRASLEIFDEVGLDALTEKSKKLTGYLEYLLDELKSDRISVITPRDEKQRGCQLSLRINSDGKNLFNKIMSKGVIVDWREPDVIRVAPVPLYNTLKDVFGFVEILKESLQN